VGLDAVEFIQAVEDAFGIAIPNEAASLLATPGHVADYLERHLSPGPAPSCHEQRAFHRLREVGTKALAQPRAAFIPSTAWEALLGPCPDAAWKRLGAEAGITAWPRRRYLFGMLTDHTTIGDTARYLATTLPHTVLADSEGWSRPRIEEILRHLIWQELGIRQFQWSDSFVEDLHVD
jgi:hypothetical protein